MSTYVAIGSVCWDVVEADPAPRLGGSVLFASRVAQAAGWDAAVITTGTPELEAAVRAALPGVDVTVQPSEHDTVMQFGRQADLGPSAVPTVADPIDLTGLASRLAAADVVHLAPIMGEITREHTHQLAGARFVGVTPQGFLRRRDPATLALELVARPGTWWAEGADAVVVSESEFERFDEPLAGAGRAVVVTRGERGCFGTTGDATVDLPGVPLEAVLPAGTIGAGDVFAAALFLAMAEGCAFAEAMDRANRRAAAHVGGTA